MKNFTILITLLWTINIALAAQAQAPDSLGPTEKALIESAFNGQIGRAHV
jgi:hypothetical protein